MKPLLAILIIASFTGIAVFGVWTMNHSSSHGHSGCIAATAMGTDCPRGNGVLPFVAFHLDAFRSFVTATFNDNLGNALLSLMALVLAAILGATAGVHYTSPTPVIDYYRRKFLESYSSLLSEKIHYWLAQHEHSPSLV